MTPSDHRPRRYEDRTPTWVGRALAWIMRWKGVLQLLPVAAIGATVGVLFMRFIVVAQLQAQGQAHTLRMDSIAVRVHVLDSIVGARFSRADRQLGTLLRAECGRSSLADQARWEMECPAHLFKGAP